MGFREGGVSAETGEKVGEEGAISRGWHGCSVIGELALANMYVVLRAEWQWLFNPTRIFKAKKRWKQWWCIKSSSMKPFSLSVKKKKISHGKLHLDLICEKVSESPVITADDAAFRI